MPPEPTYIHEYVGSRALIVGINSYSDPRFMPLGEAEHDAKSIAEILAGEPYQFGVTTLLGEQATKRNVLQALYNLRVAQGDERIFVYFACHGYTLTDRFGSESGYLAMVDTVPEQDFTALHIEEVVSLRRHTQAKHIAFVFDACFSGQALGLTRAVSSAAQKYLERRAYQVISAGAGDQTVSDFNSMTDLMVEALTSRRAARHGVFTVSDLGLYLQQTMAADSGQTQIPQFGHLRGSQGGEFVFFLDDSPRLTEDLEAALGASNPHIRWGGATALIELLQSGGDQLEPGVVEIARKRLQEIADEDPDERVRTVARAYLEEKEITTLEAEGKLHDQEAEARLDDVIHKKEEAEAALRTSADASLREYFDKDALDKLLADFYAGTQEQSAQGAAPSTPAESEFAPPERRRPRRHATQIIKVPAAVIGPDGLPIREASSSTLALDELIDDLKLEKQRLQRKRLSQQQAEKPEIAVTAPLPQWTPPPASPEPDPHTLPTTIPGDPSAQPARHPTIASGTYEAVKPEKLAGIDSTSQTVDRSSSRQQPAHRPARRQPPPFLLIGGIVLVALVLLGVLGITVLSLANQDRPSAAAEATATSAPGPQATVPEAGPTAEAPPSQPPAEASATPLIDAPPASNATATPGPPLSADQPVFTTFFDEAAYEGLINTDQWLVYNTEGAAAAQLGGQLVLTTQGAPGEGVSIYFNDIGIDPTEGRIYVQGSIRLLPETQLAGAGYGEARLALYSIFVDNSYLVYSCHLGRLAPAFVVCTANIWNIDAGEYNTLYSAGYRVTEIGAQHAVRIEVRPDLGADFFIDGEPVGTYGSASAQGLLENRFSIAMFSNNDTGVLLVGGIDDLSYGRTNRE